ncbi:hypothetical protein EJ110_NYTH33928 [Nymphaea thermarum]|nr:hypothetical protein EJ110_NYTH33928 [Nymphaea thermarum]
MLSQDLKKFVDQSLPPPSKTIPAQEAGLVVPTREYLPWLRPEQLALSWIKATVSEAVLGQILHMQYAKEAWDLLEKTYGSQSPLRIMMLKKEWNFIGKGNLSMSEYLDKIKLLADTLVATGQTIDNDNLIQGDSGAAWKGNLITRERGPWDSFSRGKGTSQGSGRGRGVASKQGKNSFQPPIGSVQATPSVVEGSSSSSHPETMIVNINKPKSVASKQGKNSFQPLIGSVQATPSVVEGSSSSSDPKTMIVNINKPKTCNLQTGKTIGGCYEQGSIYIMSDSVGFAVSSTSSLSSSFQWHLRLGSSREIEGYRTDILNLCDGLALAI